MNEKIDIDQLGKRTIDRLKNAGVNISDPPMLMYIGNTKAVIGNYLGERLAFAVQDVQPMDETKFGTLFIDDKPYLVARSSALDRIREKERREKEEAARIRKPEGGSQVKLSEEWGGLDKWIVPGLGGILVLSIAAMPNERTRQAVQYGFGIIGLMVGILGMVKIFE